MDRYIQGFFDELGDSTFSREAEQHHIEFYRNKLPDKLLEFWQLYGFCGFKNGLFWVVDPAEYESVLNAWICDSELVDYDNYYVIARSAFGELYLWGTKTGNKFKIKTSTGWILEEDGAEKKIERGNSELAIQLFFALQHTKYFNMDDCNTKKPLFDQAIKKFGALKENEVFGFEPALFLGGEQTLDKLNKLDLQTHLSILADFGHREFIDEDELARRAFGG